MTIINVLEAIGIITVLLIIGAMIFMVGYDYGYRKGRIEEITKRIRERE